jgi:hypothetical protein
MFHNDTIVGGLLSSRASFLIFYFGKKSRYNLLCSSYKSGEFDQTAFLEAVRQHVFAPDVRSESMTQIDSYLPHIYSYFSYLVLEYLLLSQRWYNHPKIDTNKSEYLFYTPYNTWRGLEGDRLCVDR